MTKSALHIAITLGLVSLVFGAPWILAATGAAAPRVSVESVAADQDRTAPVVFVLPAPQARPAEPEPEHEPEHETETASEPAPTAAPSLALQSPVGTPIAGAVETESVVVAPKPTVDKPVRQRVPRARVARAPRELTKKQQRKRRRHQRIRDRLAEQPQCHELIDQIVPVSEGEWWVGRDLVGCYRAHPRQFARMGGMQWVDDADDKRLGLKVYVSRRPQGDVARAVGFRRGDVLRSLNGVPLRSTAGSSLAAMQLLGRRARITFLRDGEEHKVLLRVVGDDKLEGARARWDGVSAAEATAELRVQGAPAGPAQAVIGEDG